MVNSRDVPTSFTLQWDAGRRLQSRARTSSSPRRDRRLPSTDNLQRKFRSSCENCRRSRVRCSGGNPCQRCAGQSALASCTYGVSQRHGKRKAPDIDRCQGGSPSQGYSSEQSTTSAQSSLPSSIFAEGHTTGDGQSGFSELLPLPVGSDAVRSFTSNINTAIIGDPMDFILPDDFGLGPFPFPGPPPNPDQLGFGVDVLLSNGEGTVCRCRQTNQELLDYIDLAIREPDKISLDKVLQSLQDIPSHVKKYLACTHCYRDCPRIIDFAMLHQRQVNLLCAITKAPRHYLKDTMRFTLGSLRLSQDEDLDHKQLVILSAARSADGLVGDFGNLVSNRVFKGKTMSEATRLNYQWLMDINKHLQSRLKIIISILEKPDWKDGGRLS